MKTFEERIAARIAEATADWENSKTLSRLSGSGGRKFGDSFFLGMAAAYRGALIDFHAVAREARTPGASSGMVRR